MLAVKLDDRFLREWAGKTDGAKTVYSRQFWVSFTLKTRWTSLLVDDSKTFVLTVWVDFRTRFNLSVDHFRHLGDFQSFDRLNRSYTVARWLDLPATDSLLGFFSPRFPWVLSQCFSKFFNFSCYSRLWPSEISDGLSRTNLVHTIRIVSYGRWSDPINRKASAQVDVTWLNLNHSLHLCINCVFVFTICIGTHAFIRLLWSSYLNNLKWTTHNSKLSINQF